MNKFLLSNTTKSILLCLSIVFASVCSAIPWRFSGLSNPDVAQTFYHAKEFARGVVPYLEAFNHHFVGYVFPFYLVANFFEITLSSIWTLNILFNLVNALFIGLIVGRFASKREAWLAGFLSATLLWAPGIGAHSFNVQSNLLPALCALLFCILPNKERSYRLTTLFITGLLFGGLLSSDQRIIVFAPLLLVPLFLDSQRRWIKSFSILAVGALTLPTLCIGYLALNGALSDFVDATIIYPLMYRNAAQKARFLGLLAYVFSAFRDGLFEIVVPCILAFFIALKKERRLVFWVPILSYLLASLLFYLLGARTYVNYLVPMLPVFIVFASLLPFWLASLGVPKFWYRATILLLVVYSSVARLHWSFNLESWSNLDRKPVTVVETMSVASEIDQLIEKDDSLFLWGYCPEIYLHSNRFSGFEDIALMTVAGSNFFSENSAEQNPFPKMVEKFKNFLKDTPPELFIDCHYKSVELAGELYQANFNFRKMTHLAFLSDALDEGYVKHSTRETTMQKFDFYLRKTK